LAVVLGRGGRPEVELRLERIRRDNVPVLQRPGGGCAVLLDPGNILFAAALPLPGIAGIHRAFARISLWLIDRLAQAGVPSVRPAGVSDLALGDRKIGGACMYRTRGLLYYATTLLVNPDLALVERYLRHPPREPEYRQGRPHRLFMGRLADLAGVTDGDDFVAALHHAGEAQPLTLDWPS
jgi:lipoate-protein ligase A